MRSFFLDGNKVVFVGFRDVTSVTLKLIGTPQEIHLHGGDTWNYSMYSEYGTLVSKEDESAVIEGDICNLILWCDSIEYFTISGAVICSFEESYSGVLYDIVKCSAIIEGGGLSEDTR